MENRNSNVIKNEAKQPQVFNVRGKRVVLDREVAALVGIDTKYLNRVVKRNSNFFNEDIAFQLTQEELLRCQNEFCGDKFVTSKTDGRGGSRYLPFAFTAEGIQVLERVLKREIPIVFEEEVEEVEVLPESSSKGTVVLYQPNENIRIDVRVDNETVWLTQEQMALLFGTKRQAISKHITNIYEVEELVKNQTCSILEQVQIEGEKSVTRRVSIYNLDMIISVGFRVNTKNGILFRQWANKVLNGVLLNGHYNDSRIDAHERKFTEIDRRLDNLEDEMGMLIKTNIPKKYGIFSGDTVYDAHMFVSSLVEKAKQKIILIDPYIDSSVLTLLTKREPGVNVTIYFDRNKLHNSEAFNQDLVLHNKQYPTVSVLHVDKLHDRFLIIDEEVYLFGASLKDLGKKMSGFAIIPFNEQEVLQKIGVIH